MKADTRSFLAGSIVTTYPIKGDNMFHYGTTKGLRVKSTISFFLVNNLNDFQFKHKRWKFPYKLF